MLITPMTGRLSVVAMLIVVVAMASLTGRGAGTTSNEARLDQSRSDMIASCRDQGAGRSYCECVADEVLERNGRNVARLRALKAEVARLRPGAAPPRLLVRATRACAAA